MLILCKMCGCDRCVKNGFVHGIQRYRCKKCLSNFVEGDKRARYTSSDHLKVIKLYLENCGIRSIERLTGIRNSQISKWIKSVAAFVKSEFVRSQSNIKSIQDIQILEIDELCTYIKKDRKTEEYSPLFGLLLIEGQTKLLILK